MIDGGGALFVLNGGGRYSKTLELSWLEHGLGRARAFAMVIQKICCDGQFLCFDGFRERWLWLERLAVGGSARFE
jgi:hypothetical protein